jgi:hypothetical protein
MGLVGESHVVCVAQLFILQIHASSFGASSLGEIMLLFSVCCGVKKLSMA